MTRSTSYALILATISYTVAVPLSQRDGPFCGLVDWLSFQNSTCGKGADSEGAKDAGNGYCPKLWDLLPDSNGPALTTCRPQAADCKAIAAAIRPTPKGVKPDDEYVTVSFLEGQGAGQLNALQLVSCDDQDNGSIMWTDHDTCLFDFYVDDPLPKAQHWRTHRGLIADMIDKLSTYVSQTNGMFSTAELEIPTYEASYLGSNSIYPVGRSIVKARLWYNPRAASCKDACGAYEGYCQN